MRHCAGCRCRRLRLPDSLPASALVGRAPDWQAAHGLLFLAERALDAGHTTEYTVGHSSPLHALIHLNDLRLRKRRRWLWIIRGKARDLEVALEQ